MNYYKVDVGNYCTESVHITDYQLIVLLMSNSYVTSSALNYIYMTLMYVIQKC
jgi:hypothetical protein